MTSNSLGGWRSDLTSYLNFLAQIFQSYHVVWTVLAPFGANGGKKERKKKEDNSPLLELLGFAATKKIRASNG